MKPLLNIIHQSDRIYFSSKPLPQATQQDIEQLSIADINKKFSRHRNLDEFTWENNILAPDDWKLSSEDDEARLADYYNKIIPQDSFVVCYINNEVGYGIFNRKKIKKGDILFYGGELTPPSDNKLSTYRMGAPDDLYVIDSEKRGGFAALFQDLYDPSIPLDDFPIEVARFNFHSKKLKLSAGNIAYLEAITDIEPYSQCGISYSKDFWQKMDLLHEIKKQYFSTDGTVIQYFLTDFLQVKELTVKQTKAFYAKREPQTNNNNTLGLSPGATTLEEHIPGGNSSLYNLLNDLKPTGVTQQSSTTKQSFDFMKGAFSSSSNKNKLLKKYQSQDGQLPTPGVALRRAAAKGNTEDVSILLKNFKPNVHETSSFQWHDCTRLGRRE